MTEGICLFGFVRKTPIPEEIKPTRETFRRGFATRLVEAHGEVGDLAEAAYVSPTTLWAWREEGGSFPDIFQTARIADKKGVTPCWLAFDAGARDPAVAERAAFLGKELEADAELARLLAAYWTATEGEREVPRAWARSKEPAEPLAGIIEKRKSEYIQAKTKAVKAAEAFERRRQQTPAPVSGLAGSTEPPLDARELKAVHAWLLREMRKSKRRELPLWKGVRKIVEALRPAPAPDPSPASAGPAGQLPEVPAAAAGGESTGATPVRHPVAHVKKGRA